MTAIENSILDDLKEMHSELLELVTSQLKAVKKYLSSGEDDDYTSEIRDYEKRINSLELSIDRECERFMARFTPVATDLRFVISILKSTIFLERMGDNAERVTDYIDELGKPYSKEILSKLELEKMIDTIIEMLGYLTEAYSEMDIEKARKAYYLDKKVNKANKHNLKTIEKYIADNPKQTKEGLFLFSTSKKLERSGDYCKHITEELIFYINAQIMRHKKIKKSKL